MTNSNENKILYKDLSYKIQGLIFDIRNDLGSGHKESIYQKALEKELINAGIKFVKEPAIKIYSHKGDYLGLYRPDFLIEDKIIMELKAVSYISKQEAARVYDYLRNSKYELAYLINFASPKLYIKRSLFTNSRKSWLEKLAVLFVAISFLFVGIRGVQAAELKFNTSQNSVAINETLAVEVLLDTEGEDINAVAGEIIYSQDFLELKEIWDGNSIVSLWVERPEMKEAGKVTFSGIIPGGFAGLLSADWQGTRPGLILKLIFTAHAAGQSTVQITKPVILLNDGKGTATTVSVNQLPVVISDTIATETKSVIEKDIDAPEPFTATLSHDPSLFSGQWFLVFATQDKGSGIDHYEVQEGNDPFIKAQSPYLLRYQKLNKTIAVKAIDRQGNEQIVKLAAPHGGSWYDKIWYLVIIIGAALVLILISRRGKIKPKYGGKNQINTR